MLINNKNNNNHNNNNNNNHNNNNNNNHNNNNKNNNHNNNNNNNHNNNNNNNNHNNNNNNNNDMATANTRGLFDTTAPPHAPTNLVDDWAGTTFEFFNGFFGIFEEFNGGEMEIKALSFHLLRHYIALIKLERSGLLSCRVPVLKVCWRVLEEDEIIMNIWNNNNNNYMK